MFNNMHFLPELLSLVRRWYPIWTGFTDENFKTEEIDYKRAASDFAKETLDSGTLRTLLDTGQHRDFIGRLKAVANKTNLLYMGIPKKGDLAIINQSGVDQVRICNAILDLLHGPGDADRRLGDFCAFVSANELPQRWAFPTYYLFLLSPDSEVFVKPSVVEWLSKLTTGTIPYNSTPTANLYADIRAGFHALRDALQPYQATDMIDVQSFVYAAYQGSKMELAPLAPPFSRIFADREQAEWAFLLFAATAEFLGGGPQDTRLSLTLRDNQTRMRLNYGPWMVTDISHQRDMVQMTLPLERAEALGFSAADQPFAADPGMAVFAIPVEIARRMPDDLMGLYEDGLDRIRDLFQGWSGAPSRHAHRPEIYAALFDEEKRDQLLANGLPTHPETVLELGLESTISSTIARDFHGFTADAFTFFSDLLSDNNKAWMEANRERWHASVLEPMRALFADLGPALKPLFDPYLLPDTLEITPTTQRTLAKIYKNWAAKPGDEYFGYYWGAFYRTGLTRQTDAQLFITIRPQEFRFGFYMGASAKDARFKQRVIDKAEELSEFVGLAGLTDDFHFMRVHPDARQDTLAITTPDDLRQWVATGDYNLLQVLSPEETVALGPALADRIFDAFRRVFPVYLWAVSDDPEAVVPRYLEAEFGPDGSEDPDPPPLAYTRADFLRNTHLAEAQADELYEVLQEKRQIILFGPPGTGKTYVARHLGRLLTGLAEPPDERLTVVQFHPAFGYEDFIEGIRPESRERDGRSYIDYPVRQGVFQRFCLAAARLGEGHPCVFIIDEINRGNVPRIFGELMYLLEYRDQPVRLAYSDKPFRIPANVYLIGTMNTADRSIALVDFALRRRFQFFHFAADPALFRRWLARHDTALPYLGDLYTALAEQAIDDPDFRIGPSYFMQEGLDEPALARIWRLNIEPALEEYYIDQRSKVDQWRWDGERVTAIRRVYGYD